MECSVLPYGELAVQDHLHDDLDAFKNCNFVAFVAFVAFNTADRHLYILNLGFTSEPYQI